MCYAATLDGARCGCATWPSLRDTSLGGTDVLLRLLVPADKRDGRH